MPREVYLVCPECGHEYNIHASIFERGPGFSMFCPMCNATFPQKEGMLAGVHPLPGAGRRD